MLVTAILNFIYFVLIEMFVMAYGEILHPQQINNDPGTNQNCRVSFVVEYSMLISILHYRVCKERLW